MIERALKLWAKTYDGIGDPEAAYLLLDRVSEIYAVMRCSNEQKVPMRRKKMAVGTCRNSTYEWDPPEER